MVFGRAYSNPHAIELLSQHSVAKAKYGEKFRSVFRLLGPHVIGVFGFPLDMEIRRRVNPVLRLLNPKWGERVLDVGCGVGYFTFALASDKGCFTAGLDIDGEDVRLAGKIKAYEKSSDANFIAGSCLALPFKRESFDKILASELIEHVKSDVLLLRQLAGALRPGGLMVLTTPYDPDPTEYMREHCKKVKAARIGGGHVRSGYSIDSLKRKLKSAGLEVVEHTYSYKRYTQFARKIIKAFGWFGAPMAFIVSYLDEFTRGGRGKCIIVSARKPV